MTSNHSSAALAAYPDDYFGPEGSIEQDLRPRRTGFDSGWKARQVEVDALQAEVARLKANESKCDGGCNMNDGPMEECSAHGRPVADVWAMLEKVSAERDDLQALIDAVLALRYSVEFMDGWDYAEKVRVKLRGGDPDE